MNFIHCRLAQCIHNPPCLLLHISGEHFFLDLFQSSLFLVGSLTQQITKALQLALESRAALLRNLSLHHLSSEKSFRQILHVHTNDVDWILTNFVLHFLSCSPIISIFWPQCLQSTASLLVGWAEILLACFHKTCLLDIQCILYIYILYIRWRRGLVTAREPSGTLESAPSRATAWTRTTCTRPPWWRPTPRGSRRWRPTWASRPHRGNGGTGTTPSPLTTQGTRARRSWAPTSGSSRLAAPSTRSPGRWSTGAAHSHRWPESACSAPRRNSTSWEGQTWHLWTNGRKSEPIVATLPCLSSQMLRKWKSNEDQLTALLFLPF